MIVINISTVTVFIAIAASCITIVNSNRLKVLVLGGTGFVGGAFIQRAYEQGYDIVSLSRRGNTNNINDKDDYNAYQSKEKSNSITWLKGDASNKELIDDIYQNYGPFDSCVHAIGLLFDNPSGLQSFNPFVSGSNSLPDKNATYDTITRITAFNAIDGLAKQQQQQCTDIKESVKKYSSFIFVSAAEAGWTCKAPVSWLERYLIAKRAVEQKLLSMNSIATSGDTNSNSFIRSVIFRPSLIWTWKRPSALLSVVPFYIGSQLGLPFVDRPVKVESLVNAMVTAIQEDTVVGIKRYKDIDRLSSQI